MPAATCSKAERSPGDTCRAASASGATRPPEGGLRRELIDVALELVEVSGTGGLSWREIARRANVSHSAPYRHFANKEELLAAVAEQGFRSLTERMVERMAGAADDVARRLEAMAIAYVEFAAENPAHFRVMFGRDVPDIDKHPALREAHDVTDSLFRSGVTSVLEEVGATGPEIDVDRFALMAWSLIHGLASLIVDGRVGDVGEAAVDPAEHVRSMTSLIRTLVAGMTPDESVPTQRPPKTGEDKA
ncbi:MAG: TetR/AcrR family transcriptional regulator [bacterium]|nr:TetR/AcrR family transcriptional regulator [bacterium]